MSRFKTIDCQKRGFQSPSPHWISHRTEKKYVLLYKCAHDLFWETDCVVISTTCPVDQTRKHEK